MDLNELAEAENRALLRARNRAERLADASYLRMCRQKTAREAFRARKAWKRAEAMASSLREVCLELDRDCANA